MWRYFKGGLLLIILFSSQIILAQNYINSPYTRFGVGDLINSGFSSNRSMGGTGVGLRINNEINYLNPASYTAMDTNSFLFMIGFTGRMATVATNYSSDQSNNGNIEYIAIAFPIKKWLKMSAGLVPYSRIQYAFTQTHDSEATGELTTFEYNGFGGFNEFYIGAGVTIKELVSLGANLNYVFGSLDRTTSSYLPDLMNRSSVIEYSEKLIASDFYTRLGLQIHPTIGDKHRILAGVTLDAKANIDVKLDGSAMRYNTADDRKVSDTIYYSIDTLAPYVFPNKLGLALSYSYDEILSVSAEYIMQDWTGTNIVGSYLTAGNYSSIRFGAEYWPAPFSVKTKEPYYKRIKYRVGAYSTETYLYYNGNSIKDRGLTVGFGIPMKNSRKLFTGSAINIGYQYGIRGTKADDLIQENYHIINVGITLHDFWFLKPKYE